MSVMLLNRINLKKLISVKFIFILLVVASNSALSAVSGTWWFPKGIIRDDVNNVAIIEMEVLPVILSDADADTRAIYDNCNGCIAGMSIIWQPQSSSTYIYWTQFGMTYSGSQRNRTWRQLITEGKSNYTYRLTLDSRDSYDYPCITSGMYNTLLSGRPSSGNMGLYFTNPPGYHEPTAGCIAVRPPNRWCALSTPKVSFDYGVMQSATASGVSREVDVTIDCSASMSYNLRLVGTSGGIPLSNGMEASITADNRPLQSTLSGNAGRNTVRLKSTLTGSPSTTGAFSGSSVLFVDYP
ncbi:hypothetical protein F3J31_21780 [Enterobacter sp. Acro-832]|uniref:hypothetical protein n=1 Tax=Enterobacter sp. Acro-832 TaxID=2608348 RepID=UPI00141D814C|nr:hypothetical protein [Enterobacter sp. Acro-832]NIG46429.1 hypothetical protein [Enterobacter sp. Acro-832]